MPIIIIIKFTDQPPDVVGFYFLDLATNFTPSDDLAAFLKAGDAPVYIGLVTFTAVGSQTINQFRIIGLDQWWLRTLQR